MKPASSTLGFVGTFLGSVDLTGESREMGFIAEAGIAFRGGGARVSSTSSSNWCLDLWATRLPSFRRSLRASCSNRSISSFVNSGFGAGSRLSLVECLRLESSSSYLLRRSSLSLSLLLSRSLARSLSLSLSRSRSRSRISRSFSSSRSRSAIRRASLSSLFFSCSASILFSSSLLLAFSNFLFSSTIARSFSLTSSLAFSLAALFFAASSAYCSSVLPPLSCSAVAASAPISSLLSALIPVSISSTCASIKLSIRASAVW